MYNQKEVSCIYGLTSKELVYESQWVIDALKGQRKIYNFLKEKFSTLHKHKVSLKAIILNKRNENQHAILLEQGEDKIGLWVEVDQDKIKRLHMVNYSFIQQD